MHKDVTLISRIEITSQEFHERIERELKKQYETTKLYYYVYISLQYKSKGTLRQSINHRSHIYDFKEIQFSRIQPHTTI